MKVVRRNVLAAAALTAAMLLSVGRPAAAADDPGVLAADRDFVQAVAKSDSAALGKLLDADFVWIDASGKTADRAKVLGGVPKSDASGASGAETRRHDYGQVDVVQTDSGKLHVLRVWVKRPAGWRALVYQE